jgi:hypothetical protein
VLSTSKEFIKYKTFASQSSEHFDERCNELGKSTFLGLEVQVFTVNISYLMHLCASAFKIKK